MNQQPKVWLKSRAGRLVSYFLQGILITAPTVVTIGATIYFFNLLDTPINDVFEKIFKFRLPGFGILMMFLFVTLIGFVGSMVFVQPLIHLFDIMLEKTPVIKEIYSALKDFFSAFISNKKKFNRPVMFEMGKGSGVYRLGFITQDNLSELNVLDKVAVYCPLSYNLSGLLYLVNIDQVQILHDVPSGDIMKFIVSGGVTEMEDDGGATPAVTQKQTPAI